MAVGPLLFFGPMMLTGEVLFWGTPILQFIPWREYALTTLKAGELPLWNPLLGYGAPLIANYQSAVFYPPNWALLVTGVPLGQTMLVMLHLWWAGVGMVLLLQSLKRNLTAQVIGGLAFSMSGYLVARSGFLSINAAAAWLPWLVLMVRRLFEVLESNRSSARVARQAVLLGTGFAMQWLAGHAQTAWYSFLLVAAWISWELFARKRRAAAVLPWLTVSGLVGLVLAAVQLLPTAEYLLHSQRAGAVDRTLAMTYSFWPWRLVGFLAPGLFGSPVSGDYWGYGNFWEDAVYIGVLPFLLAVYAAVRALRRGQGPVRMLGLIGGAAFLLALGKNTPIFPLLYEYIPSFSLFQAPTRWNLILVFALAIMSAYGAHAWAAARGRALYWLRLLTAGSGVIAFAALLGSQLLPGSQVTFVRAFVIAGLALFGSGLLALLLPALPPRLWRLAVMSFVMVDLTVAGLGLNPGAPLSVFSGSSKLAGSVPPGARLYMHPKVEHELKFERAFRFDRFRTFSDWRLVRDWGVPNTPVLDQLPSANNFDPIQPARFEAWMEELARSDPGRQRELLALTGVGYASLETDEAGNPEYDIIPITGRVRIVGSVEAVSSAGEALARIFDDSLGLDSQGVVEAVRPDGLPSGGPGQAQISQESANTVQVAVDAPVGGWLWLADTWYPGWSASIDGEAVEIFRMNYLFRGVWVPAGSEQVTFAYRPTVFQVGLVLTLTGVMSVAALAVVWWRE